MFEFREIKSEVEYKPLELMPDAPFTQAWFFGEWQEKMGRKARRFEIINGSETIGFFQIIKYPLPFGQSFLYIPHGPVLLATCDMRQVKKELSQTAKEENVVFVRFDFYFYNSNYGSTRDLDKFFKKTPNYAYYSSYFQPKYEWILDLGKSEEKLLQNMHPKTRYNIHLAENKNIQIEIVSNNFEKYFDIFYELLSQTAQRNKFYLHSENYYRNVFKTLNEKDSFLALACYGDKILAANLILLFGETAYFLFGGSSDEYKNLMAPHLAHWHGILEARRRNYTKYNFGAINGMGWEGISRFKKGFGGQLLEYSDSYDLVSKSFWYWLYNLRKRYW